VNECKPLDDGKAAAVPAIAAAAAPVSAATVAIDGEDEDEDDGEEEEEDKGWEDVDDDEEEETEARHLGLLPGLFGGPASAAAAAPARGPALAQAQPAAPLAEGGTAEGAKAGAAPVKRRDFWSLKNGFLKAVSDTVPHPLFCLTLCHENHLNR